MTDLLTLPNVKFSEWSLRPVSLRSISRVSERVIEAVSIGSSYWELSSAITGYLQPEEIDAMELFLHKASKGSSVVQVYDYFNPRPRTYGSSPLSGTRALGGSFDGTAVIDTVTSSILLSLSGLPAGFVINAGCLIEVRKSSLERSLHRVGSDVVASGTGHADVSLVTPLSSVFTAANSIVTFEKPACLMMVSPDWVSSRSWDKRQVSFSATEVFPS